MVELGEERGRISRVGSTVSTKGMEIGDAASATS
jgi:hypothetical protein